MNCVAKLSVLPFAAMIFASNGCTSGATPSGEVRKEQAMKTAGPEADRQVQGGGGIPTPPGVASHEGAVVELNDLDPNRPAQADSGKGFRPPIPATICCVALSLDGKRG